MLNKGEHPNKIQIINGLSLDYDLPLENELKAHYLLQFHICLLNNCQEVFQIYQFQMRILNISYKILLFLDDILQNILEHQIKNFYIPH
jgi:hypothetical protein